MAITIRHGVNSLTLDHLAGSTVEHVREQVADMLNVPASAQVRVNGSLADGDTILADNSTVEFVKIAGEKGAAIRL